MKCPSLLVVSLLALTGCHELQDVLDVVSPRPVSLEHRPATSGGNVHVTADDRYVVMTDPNYDALTVATTDTDEVVAEVSFGRSSEPGRITDGAEGRIHVVLRGSGKLASVSLPGGDVVEREVCPAPRGVAHDEASGRLLVSCAGGEVVSFDESPQASEPLSRWKLEPDLRDIVVVDGEVFVSTFRRPALLRLNGEGEVVQRLVPKLEQIGMGPGAPTVAWRTRLLPDGRIAMLHQMSLSGELGGGQLPPGAPPVYYGGTDFCAGAVVEHAITFFDVGKQGQWAIDAELQLQGLVVAFDFDVSRQRQLVVVSSSGYADVNLAGLPKHANQCALDSRSATSVSFSAAGRAYVANDLGLHRTGLQGEPAAQVITRVAPENTGHQIFHRTSAGAPIACASCHPEGRDDAHVWQFAAGPRRSHSLLGSTAGTAPYHWEGDIHSFSALMDEVYTERMRGRRLSDTEMAAVEHWMTKTLRPLRFNRELNEGAVDRGRTLYEDPEVACASCHEGRGLTLSFDVGTGGTFQAPPLFGLQLRAPLMHDGCAQDIRARFDPECGGGDRHGKTSHLSETELDDLIAYLESL